MPSRDPLPTLLVLDLDETLIHATATPAPRQPDFTLALDDGEYGVFRRPFLDEFLAFAFSEFADVAFWTTATDDYARAVVDQILPAHLDPLFVWSRRRCTHRSDPDTRAMCWLKDIRKLRRWGYPKARILFVDDNAEVIQRSYGNHVPMVEYRGAADDDELSRLIPFLGRLVRSEDVRRPEKRFWHKAGPHRDTPSPADH